MTLNETKKFGRTIGGQSRDIEETQQQISPDQSQAQSQIAISDRIKLKQSLQIYSKELPNAFVLDHPVLGYLGGGLEFNQRYLLDLVTMPITMPIKIEPKIVLLYDSEV